MALVLFVLLLVLALGALGFVLHALWWLALIALVVWGTGFVMRLGEESRWYRW
jgi:hypothetical protein